MKRALLLNNKDTVASVLEHVDKGDNVSIVGADGDVHEEISALQAIELGHKIALKEHGAGMDVVKYGYAIGSASESIRKGDCVHIHNLDSKRGRGDLC